MKLALADKKHVTSNKTNRKFQKITELLQFYSKQSKPAFYTKEISEICSKLTIKTPE